MNTIEELKKDKKESEKDILATMTYLKNKYPDVKFKLYYFSGNPVFDSIEEVVESTDNVQIVIEL